MTERIILSLIAVLMTTLTLRQPGKWPKVITIAQTLGILSIWPGNMYVTTSGFILYTLSALAIIIYCGAQVHLSLFQKLLMGISSGSALLINLFMMLQAPVGNLVYVLVVLPVISLLGLLMLNKRQLTAETGFMTILAMESALKFL